MGQQLQAVRRREGGRTGGGGCGVRSWSVHNVLWTLARTADRRLGMARSVSTRTGGTGGPFFVCRSCDGARLELSWGRGPYKGVPGFADGEKARERDLYTVRIATIATGRVRGGGAEDRHNVSSAVGRRSWERERYYCLRTRCWRRRGKRMVRTGPSREGWSFFPDGAHAKRVWKWRLAELELVARGKSLQYWILECREGK